MVGAIPESLTSNFPAVVNSVAGRLRQADRGKGCSRSPSGRCSPEVRFSLTAEQLEAARAERLRQNASGTLNYDDARTWIEETGLCLFLPKKPGTTAVAPSFVEAVAGHELASPDGKLLGIAEDLLVRLELKDVAVRLNLHGVAGLAPDYVVASWVLPYVYALRGDRDWRRTPQLTGSRQVSPLAIQAYKKLEQGDASIPMLRTQLGREVTEAAVLRSITELWQQLRIIPVTPAPGSTPKWQLLRHRYQKAIAEGASTSQVTAISVLASIYLQAVIAASMEEVEYFLAPLTSRSKVREVMRGLVATRQVNTTNIGHSSYFYVAGTLPEFPAIPSVYASSSISNYSFNGHEDEISIAASGDGGYGRMYSSAYSSGHRPAFGNNHSNGHAKSEENGSDHRPARKAEAVKQSRTAGSWKSKAAPRTGTKSKSGSRTTSRATSRATAARPTAKPTAHKPKAKRLASAGSSSKSGKRR